jgi:two-component system response regulator
MNQEVEILLAEDNMSDAELTIHALKKDNLVDKLVHVKDGSEALDFIFAKGSYLDRQVENLPRVILMDLKMPKIDGIQVLQKIKSDERTKKIPVVILTSSKEEQDIIECYELGVNSYVVKSMEFKTFVKAVRDIAVYWLNLNQTSQ